LAGHLSSQKVQTLWDMSILMMEGAVSISNHTRVKILNTGKSIVVVDNFWNSKPESIPRIRRITGKDFPFYEVNLLDRDSLTKLFTENEISAVIHFVVLTTVGNLFEFQSLLITTIVTILFFLN
jgi:UDP-glucose 4-epimerase